MTAPALSNAAEAARPTVEVRDHNGAMLPRISVENANVLHSRGWALWIGKGARRHLTLTADAPLHRLAPGSKAGTKRDRADQTCRVYKHGQAFGGSHQVEFIPTS